MSVGGGERERELRFVDLFELTTSGHPKMENGSRPEENHVSNTSSSVKNIAHKLSR